MKRIGVVLCCWGLSLPLFAFHETGDQRHFDLDAAHTGVVWSVDHFGFSRPSGKFTQVEGELLLDEQKPEHSKLRVKIRMDSVSSGVEKLDEHLKSADFFDVKKYPVAEFEAKDVTQAGSHKAKVAGKLTLRGVTKPLVLDVKLNKSGEHPVTKKRVVGFSAEAVIKRSDFGMTYALPGVSDEVKLHIETEAVMTDK